MKKAQLMGGAKNVVLFGVLVIAIAIMGLIFAGFEQSFCVGGTSTWNATAGQCQAVDGTLNFSDYSIAQNVTLDGGAGLLSMGSLLNPLGIILIAAILIAVLVGAFLVFRNR